MRELVIETKGKGIRTIQIGREKKLKNKLVSIHIDGLICSPRILIRNASWDCCLSDIKCWKTTKSGLSHARKNWQRHGERQPSVRRHRWGRKRNPMYPSVRVLNELGRCIYPCVDERDYLEYIMEEV